MIFRFRRIGTPTDKDDFNLISFDEFRIKHDLTETINIKKRTTKTIQKQTKRNKQKKTNKKYKQKQKKSYYITSFNYCQLLERSL